jgi:tetratricopeptide (TPR) repeat protein
MIRQQSPPKVPASAGRRDERWRVPAVCLVLAAITFAVFGQTLRHEFINFDDGDYVYGNAMVIRGLTLKGIVWAFTTAHAANWHPLTWLSHMLDCQLYGLHPAGHHLTGVLLHTATVIALFLVLRQMTGALWRSAFVAAVFAIHPLRVESVAWVAERKDVLSGLFFMLTIGAYVRYARGPWSLARYGLVMLLFAMGLMCKPMLVTLPLVLLLLDYWPLQRVEPRKLSGLVLEKLPLLALSAASCVATLLAQKGAIQATESYSMPLHFANALAACLVYLGQMVWPARLAAFYPYPRHGLPAWEVALAGTLLAGLSAVAWAQRRKQPWIVVGWLWYMVMLLPVLGIIQVGGQAHADRYTYLPGIGVVMAGTWLVGDWSRGWKHQRAVLGGLMAVVMGVLMVCAWKKTMDWKNSETLWTQALTCTTGNDVAHINLGASFFKKGRVDEAIAEYQKALEINPRSVGAHFDLGNALRKKGSVDEAITQFQSALRIDPKLALTHINLGIALFQKGKVDEAITQYQEALELKADNVEAQVNLANALRQKGKLDEAITHYENGLQIDPDYVEAQNNLGLALMQKGKVGEAIAHFQKALQLKPAEPSTQNNLAWLLAVSPEASVRDGNKAVELARQANDLTGGENPVILNTLAAAYAEAGRFAEALETARRALPLAGAQSDTKLAGQLQYEMKLYQAGRPFHISEKTH